MTAAHIISEIKSLTPEEQAGVVRFVYKLDAERKLSGPELSTLAERLVQTDDPIESLAGARIDCPRLLRRAARGLRFAGVGREVSG